MTSPVLTRSVRWYQAVALRLLAACYYSTSSGLTLRSILTSSGLHSDRMLTAVSCLYATRSCLCCLHVMLMCRLLACDAIWCGHELIELLTCRPYVGLICRPYMSRLHVRRLASQAGWVPDEKSVKRHNKTRELPGKVNSGVTFDNKKINSGVTLTGKSRL